MRFSLWAMFCMLTFCAIAFAALVYPSLLWTALLVNVAMFSLFGAIIGATSLSGRPRAFCRGFTFACIFYVALVGIDRERKSLFVTQIAANYVGTRILRVAVNTDDPLVEIAGEPPADKFTDVYTFTSDEHFRIVSGSVAMLLVSFVGGFLSLYFESRSKSSPLISN